jgi:hypothetical protein
VSAVFGVGVSIAFDGSRYFARAAL